MTLPSLIIIIFFALIPAMGWLVLYYLQDFKDYEPKKVLLKLFLMGALMAIPFVLLRYLVEFLMIQSILMTGLLSVFVFAALEEIAKLFAAVFVISYHRIEFNQLVDGVIYAVVAALGFSFIENIFYLTSIHSTGIDWSFFLYGVAFRSVGAMLAHTLFSATTGLIWAYAYFSTQITPFKKHHLLVFKIKDWLDHEMLTLHIIRNNVLQARPSRRGGHEKKVLVMEGLMLGIFMHAGFNLMTSFEILGQNLTFLLVPMLVGGLFYFLFLFTKQFNTKLLKVI